MKLADLFDYCSWKNKTPERAPFKEKVIKVWVGEADYIPAVRWLNNAKERIGKRYRKLYMYEHNGATILEVTEVQEAKEG